MTRWHNYYVDNHAHFCTATVADWRPLLVGGAVDVLYEEWERARQSFGVRVLAYVVMPEHFHCILWGKRGDDIKASLSRSLGETSRRLQPGGGFWKERPRVLPVHSRSVLQTKVDYIHRNPLRRELAALPEDWQHSSFRQLGQCATDVAFLCDGWDCVAG